MPLSYNEAKSLVNNEDKSFWLAQNANRIDCKVLSLDDAHKNAKVTIVFDDNNQSITLIRELVNSVIKTVDMTNWLLDPMCLPYMLTEPKPERKRRTRKSTSK